MEERSFHIELTPVAYKDLDSIYYRSILFFGKKLAEKQINQIKNNILVLKSKGYRKVTSGSYIIFYIIIEKEDKVVIMRILHNKRNYSTIVE